LHSIKKSLLILITVPVLFISTVIVSLSIYSVYDEIGDMYDLQLGYYSKLLSKLVENNDNLTVQTKISASKLESHHRYETDLIFRVFKNDNLIAYSKDSPNFNNIKAPKGYSNQIINGSRWRFFGDYNPESKIFVEVGEEYEIRTEIIREILLSFLIPLALLIPLFVICIIFGTKKSLKTLINLSTSVNNREINDLSRIPLKNNPSEVFPIINALNSLFVRISESFEKEKQFTDNAAHELRTPLAALKIQTQLVLKNTKDKDFAIALNDIMVSINRMEKMVNQLLTFSRLQNNQIQLVKANVSNIVNSVIKDIGSLAINKKQELILNIEPNIYILAEESSLYIAIKNLVDNAIKYSPANSSITVKLYVLDYKVILEVIDCGAGLKDDDLEHVFDRFYRNKTQVNEVGSGLGLAIVKWVLDFHNSSITIKNNNTKGVTAKVIFNYYL
jgi:two-component system, OmpR family, sensor histidine kinase QseC